MSQPAEVITEIKRHYDSLSAEFAGPDGLLVLRHEALLGVGRA